MIDIHNFARFNGQGAIIGQGGPPDEQFVSLWTQLATKYASNEKVVFELMNEPHDLDVGIWAQTCQKVVNGIRRAGATSQMILLPGTNFDSAATLVSSGSADALMAITNPDGSTDNLLLDIHKYLDIDNSGTHSECTTDNVGNFSIVADYLRQKGRKGLVSETGASSASSCMTAFCAQNSFINANPDVFVGLVGWGAGSFQASYVLSLTPTKQGNRFVDNQLMSQCVINTWLNSANVTVPPPGSPPGGSSPPGTHPGSPPGSESLPASSRAGGRPSVGTATVTGLTVGATLLTTGSILTSLPSGQFGGQFGGQPGILSTGPGVTGPTPAPTSVPNTNTATLVRAGAGSLLVGFCICMML